MAPLVQVRSEVKQFTSFGHAKLKPLAGLNCARPTGLEPATSPVTGECSNQLSYGRIEGQNEDTTILIFSEYSEIGDSPF
jgi:hypothetical protein